MTAKTQPSASVSASAAEQAPPEPVFVEENDDTSDVLPHFIRVPLEKAEPEEK